MSRGWSADEIPSQEGRLAIVTGANSGLGLVTALELARRGAKVVMACRSVDKGRAAAGEIARATATATATGAGEPDVRELDLGSLASIHAFARELSAERVDLLINNAGVMMTPRKVTADGFELQLGTNHLGHFALTGLLLDALERSDNARVVTLSSNEHKGGRLDFDDLQLERDYSPRASYQRSKLANAVFAIELDRRLRAKGSPAISVFAHPGYSSTNLQSTGPTGFVKAALKISNRLLAQPAARGALPTLYAATAPGVEGGEYYGPDGLAEMRGSPKRVRAIAGAYDPETGARLWRASEKAVTAGAAIRPSGR